MALSNNCKRVNISISNVAPLIGLDAYNNFPKIVCELWRRYDPNDFKVFETKLKTEGSNISTSNEFNDIWEMDELLGTNILDKVKQINQNKDKTSSEMVKSQEEIKTYITQQTKLSDEDKNELIKKVCSITNKSHGVCNEDTILAEFCRLSEKQIINTQGWLEKNIETEVKLPINWVLVGKYDGITNENELVEAKMRQKCLFKRMRDYENVQVQLYLHILKYEHGFLIESYKNKKGNTDMYVNEVKYDNDYVNEVILKRLGDFVIFFDNFIGDENMKIGLLSGDKSRKIFNNYKTDYLGIEEEIDF